LTASLAQFCNETAVDQESFQALLWTQLPGRLNQRTTGFIGEL
jgi:hypothetical protein